MHRDELRRGHAPHQPVAPLLVDVRQRQVVPRRLDAELDLHLAQCRLEIGHVLVPIVAVLGEALHDQGLELLGHLQARALLGQRRRRALEVEVHHLGGLAVLGRHGGEQLVGGDPQGVHVHAMVGRLAGPALGRHVDGRAHGMRLDAGSVEDPGHAEVHELDRVAPAVALTEQHVLRLDVAMENPGLVRGLRPLQIWRSTGINRSSGMGPLATSSNRSPPLDELQRDEEAAVGQRAQVVDLDDVVPTRFWDAVLASRRSSAAAPGLSLASSRRTLSASERFTSMCSTS